MIIYGEKIVLRAVEAEDNDMLLELINDPETETMLGGSSWPISRAEQLSWFEKQEKKQDVLRCIVAIKETEKAVGTVILSDINQKNGTAQIHIKMSNDGGRGKGYGTDAIKTMIKYALAELRLNCIYAEILTYNEISKHLFEKCGFKQEGVLRSRVYKGGKYVDVLSYSILKSELLQ